MMSFKVEFDVLVVVLPVGDCFFSIDHVTIAAIIATAMMTKGIMDVCFFCSSDI